MARAKSSSHVQSYAILLTPNIKGAFDGKLWLTWKFSVFMGLFVYNTALIGVFKNRWKVMFGKWSIIMPEFLLRVPRWSEFGGAWADLGLSIVGINYNPIITSIVWTLSSELLQLCSHSLFCQCSIRWQSRDRWSVFVWFIKNIFSMLVWDKSIRSVIAGHDTRYIFTHTFFYKYLCGALHTQAP